MKRVCAVILIVALMCLCGCSGEKPAAEAYLLAADGTPYAAYDGTLALEEAAYSAYAKYALLEAAGILAAQSGGAVEDALGALKADGCTVETAADLTEIAAVSQVGDAFSAQGDVPFAAAVTDLTGRLTAVYATAGQVEKTYAGSAIKPLSVYAPGVESGLIDWSAMQPDSPVKMLATDGGETPWPANGSGVYSERDVTAAEALRASLNTVAVRWLQAYGVENAMRFLDENFDIDLEKEWTVLSMASPDEVLGNIALGYLQAGVDVCEMAGYYQIFANGGQYVPAYAVTRILTAAGDVLYTAAPAARRVIGEDTAYILNRMLLGVVERGTGVDARVNGVETVGKTGTSDNYEDNWFIGVTAQNTVAVWHGRAEKNSAAALFSQILPAAGLQTDARFAPCETVAQRVYCPLSGGLITANCPGMERGYYKQDDVPAACGLHP